MPYQNTLENYAQLVHGFYIRSPKIYFIMPSPSQATPKNSNRELYKFKIDWEGDNTIIINGNEHLFVELLDIFRDYIEDNSLDIRRFQENEVVFNLNTTSIRKEFDQVRIALMEDYHAKTITANAQTDKALDMLFSLYER